ncbi:MAG: hypothetical protein L0Y54_01890 [Sporichthyaceae bacterium]|nr:hypothetical protein [Sporichthyaceae bacterium]
MSTTRGHAPPNTGPARLPVAHRERHPAAVVLGVLLILVGGLVGVLAWQSAGDRIDVIQLTNRIPAGSQIADDDIRAVTVAPDDGIAYVRWDERDQLGGYYALSDLQAGSVLTGGMLTPDAPPAAGEVVIGLALQAGQYPPDLKVGDRVNALFAPRGGNPEGVRILAAGARIGSVVTSPSDDGLAGDASIAVIVSTDEGPLLAQASAAGQVALVLVAQEPR